MNSSTKFIEQKTIRILPSNLTPFGNDEDIETLLRKAQKRDNSSLVSDVWDEIITATSDHLESHTTFYFVLAVIVTILLIIIFCSCTGRCPRCPSSNNEESHYRYRSY